MKIKLYHHIVYVIKVDCAMDALRDTYAELFASKVPLLESDGETPIIGRDELKHIVDISVNEGRDGVEAYVSKLVAGLTIDKHGQSAIVDTLTDLGCALITAMPPLHANGKVKAEIVRVTCEGITNGMFVLDTLITTQEDQYVPF